MIGSPTYLHQGNLDSVNQLLHTTPERLETYVKDTLAAGTPDQVREYLRRYEACGVDQVILARPDVGRADG